MRRALLALLAGGALTLSFPGSGIWVLAPVGVGALALATRGTSIRTGAGLGLLAGLACFLPTLSWTGTYVGALPWVALAILQALYVAFAGAVSSALQRGVSVAGADRVRPFVVALAWVGSEALRARTPYGGFPWARIAFTQADSPLAHIAALAGAPGVTFAVALAGGVLASAVAPRATLSAPTDLESPGAFSTRVGVAGSTRSRVVAMPRWRRLGVAVVLVVSPLAVPLYSEGRPADVMAVQGNVPHPGLDFNAERRAVLDNHVSATTRAAAQVRAGSLTQPDLVVWPENSSDIDPVRNTDAALQVNLALEAIRAPLLIGTLRIGDDRSVRNVAELYEAGRGLVAEYTKRHPVPFAEYIPNRAFFRLFSDKVDLLTRDFSAGSAPGLF
ncbi:MAG TPA: apolipoprotein N-acyltransferase, partial [Candidatus Lustribacter sp.]|nr:apolipoprotein N-acyltransferase [Candidatus Lustribacter sp.]